MKRILSLILAVILIFGVLLNLASCDILSGLTADTDALKNQIETLEKTVLHAEARIETLQSEKASLEEKNAELIEEKGTLKANITALEAEIAELESRVAELENQVDNSDTDYEATIGALNTQIETLKSEKAELNDDVAELEGKVSGLEKQLVDAEAEHSTAVGALNAEIETLNTQISTLSGEKSSMSARISELEGEISSLNTTISAKNAEITQLNSTVASLNSEISALNARVAELEAENAAQKDEIAALRRCLAGEHNFVRGVCSVCGCEQEGYVTPYERDGDYIYFGEYPQTIKANDVEITSTVDERGYYLGSDGSWYAKVTASPLESGYTFSSGSTVCSGSAYYFKVELIRWRIFSTDGETALIVCDSIIANKAYDGGKDNNYANSDIRVWLNATFYETAFSDLQREIILTTTVDNNVASTGYSSNPYACEDTDDNIFLLSYLEAKTYMPNYADRRMETSDYSRATGAWMYTSSSYYGNGFFWLRSPDYNNYYYARYVNRDGSIDYYSHVGSSHIGVVPALQIRL